MKRVPDADLPATSRWFAGDYSDQSVALLTRHGKERVIAPVLERALGCRVEVVAGYDTDLLGTFTREIPRASSHLETARTKARIGMELSGHRLGVASEGSFGPDPFLGFSGWDVEMVVFLDAENQLEIVGIAQGDCNFDQTLTGDWAVATVFARKVGFPEHHLVVRPEADSDSRIRKDIDSWAKLEVEFASARAQASNGLVFVETDMRAHANPRRMARIATAAEDLAKKLKSRCPGCGVPGYWIGERLAGLPCADCGEPTAEIRAYVFGCTRCGHREQRLRIGPHVADPVQCPLCNP